MAKSKRKVQSNREKYIRAIAGIRAISELSPTLTSEDIPSLEIPKRVTKKSVIEITSQYRKLRSRSDVDISKISYRKRKIIASEYPKYTTSKERKRYKPKREKPREISYPTTYDTPDYDGLYNQYEETTVNVPYETELYLDNILGILEEVRSRKDGTFNWICASSVLSAFVNVDTQFLARQINKRPEDYIEDAQVISHSSVQDDIQMAELNLISLVYGHIPDSMQQKEIQRENDKQRYKTPSGFMELSDFDDELPFD